MNRNLYLPFFRAMVSILSISFSPNGHEFHVLGGIGTFEASIPHIAFLSFLPGKGSAASSPYAARNLYLRLPSIFAVPCIWRKEDRAPPTLFAQRDDDGRKGEDVQGASAKGREGGGGES